MVTIWQSSNCLGSFLSLFTMVLVSICVSSCYGPELSEEGAINTIDIAPPPNVNRTRPALSTAQDIQKKIQKLVEIVKSEPFAFLSHPTLQTEPALAAWRELEKIGKPAVPALVNLLQDDRMQNTLICINAAEVLAGIERDDNVLAAFAQVLSSSRNKELVMALVVYAGLLSDQSLTLPIVQAIINHAGCGDIRDNAIFGLKMLKEPRLALVIDTLRDAERSTEVRILHHELLPEMAGECKSRDAERQWIKINGQYLQWDDSTGTIKVNHAAKKSKAVVDPRTGAVVSEATARRVQRENDALENLLKQIRSRRRK